MRDSQHFHLNTIRGQEVSLQNGEIFQPREQLPLTEVHPMNEVTSQHGPVAHILASWQVGVGNSA